MFPGAQAQQVGQQAAQTANNPIQNQLVQLATSPYGDNPLFKNLVDSGRREDILKPINPVAQKALDGGTQYKVSPHRNIKAKAKPVSSAGNKSAIFEGMEDDDVIPKSDTFVPRSSVKKLVLKLSLKSPKSQTGSPAHDKSMPPLVSAGSAGAVASGHGSDVSGTASPLQMSLDQTQNKSIDESLNLPTVKKNLGAGGSSNNVSIVDDSFAVLNPQKNRNKANGSKNGVNKSKDCDNTGDVSVAGSEELELEEDTTGPADVTLRRVGYYTIPKLADLSMYVDESTGSCLVENFTVGREGYGNIFFPGVTNVSGLNLDEIVFIRHKEVIVYPDDSKKPPLGEGLNKKAQVTLDKVWPVDKTNKATIQSPTKLAQLGFEERLQNACIKLGARFVEYRCETGSWVFKVDHFSKYGLDDSDEEDGAKTAKPDQVKRLKTLQLREQPKQPPVAAAAAASGKEHPMVTTTASVHAEMDQSTTASSLTPTASSSATGTEQASPQLQRFARMGAAAGTKVQMMKASLFDGSDDDEMEVSAGGRAGEKEKSRPVVLKAR